MRDQEKDSDGLDPDSERRKKGRILGYIIIFFGIVGPLVSYFLDKHSLDMILMMDAAQTAFLQATVFVLVGICVVVYYSLSPPSNDDDERYLGPRN